MQAKQPVYEEQPLQWQTLLGSPLVHLHPRGAPPPSGEAGGPQTSCLEPALIPALSPGPGSRQRPCCHPLPSPLPSPCVAGQMWTTCMLHLRTLPASSSTKGRKNTSSLEQPWSPQRPSAPSQTLAQLHPLGQDSVKGRACFLIRKYSSAFKNKIKKVSTSWGCESWGVLAPDRAL